jgi:ADP-ribosylglycohydrolase
VCTPSLSEEGPGAAVKAAIASVLANVEAGQSYVTAAPGYGIGCGNPGSFSGGLHAALAAGSYADAVRAAILGGGDSCSRAILAGSLTAAAGGLASVPKEWVDKTTSAAKALSAAQTLLA